MFDYSNLHFLVTVFFLYGGWNGVESDDETWIWAFTLTIAFVCNMTGKGKEGEELVNVF